jgi:hypothetical protein
MPEWLASGFDSSVDPKDDVAGLLVGSSLGLAPPHLGTIQRVASRVEDAGGDDGGYEDDFEETGD